MNNMINTKLNKFTTAILLLFVATIGNAYSQKNVGIGTNTPAASAILDLDVSDLTLFPENGKLGFLAPRVSENQKSLMLPVVGLLVYQTDVDPGFYYCTSINPSIQWTRIIESGTGLFLRLDGGTMTGEIDMNDQIITNIGDLGTDFLSSGGLNLADRLTVSNNGIFVNGNSNINGILTGLTGIESGGNITLTGLLPGLIVKTDNTRTLIAGSIDLASETEVSGILPLALGGTGLSLIPAVNQLLIGNGSSGYSLSTLDQGDGILITNVAGTLTIATDGMEQELTFSPPLGRVGNAISINPATIDDDGYLSSSDWDMFNNKQNFIPAGTNTQYYSGDKTWVEMPNSLPPSGIATGDLSGTYPNPTVSKLLNRSISTATPPQTGQTMVWNEANLMWEYQTVGTVSSVGLTILPAANGIFTIADSPVINTGSISIAIDEQLPHTVLAGPASGALEAVPTFRLLNDDDIPNEITITGMLTGTGTATQLSIFSNTNQVTSNSNLIFETNTLSITGNIAAKQSGANTGIVSFYDLDNSNYVNIKSPDVVGTNFTYILPSTNPNDGQILQANSSGVMAWIDKSSALPVGTAGQTLRYDASNNLIADDEIFIETAAPNRIGIGTNDFTDDPSDTLKLKVQGDARINGDLIVTGNIDPTSIIFQPQGTAPVGAYEGMMYYNAVTKQIKVKTNADDLSTSWSSILLSSTAYTFPATDGISGQVLTTGGNGELSWNSLSSAAIEGISGQTLIYNSENELVASSSMINTGTNIGIGVEVPLAKLHVNGAIAFIPGTSSDITNKSYIKISVAGPIVFSGTPVEGQVLVIQVLGAINATLTDGSGFELTGNWSGEQNDTITLIYDGAQWVEIARSNN